MQFSKYIDHTLLGASAIPEEIIQLCKEAKEYNFYAVCVNSCHLNLAREELRGSDIKLASVIGFPLGAMATEAKVHEAEYCKASGANEIDMVINIGWLKSGQESLIIKEIQQIKQSIGPLLLKVILEVCYLSSEEIELGCRLIEEAGADFVKTSTGFGPTGASFESVALIRKCIGSRLQIKASGGIKDFETAKRYVDMGVSRIGTSSGVSILNSKI